MIQTANGNYFVFKVSKRENPKPNSAGYYATPEGHFVASRENAKNEIEWMEREWPEKPVIEHADTAVFGDLFNETKTFRVAYTDKKEGDVDSPFAGLAEFLNK